MFSVSVLPLEIIGSVASLLAATIYKGNHDRKYKLRNIVSTEEIYTPLQVLQHIKWKFHICEN
jgi:hypothetical protein